MFTYSGIVKEFHPIGFAQIIGILCFPVFLQIGCSHPDEIGLLVKFDCFLYAMLNMTLIEMGEKVIEGVTNEREKNYAVATMLVTLVKVNLINPAVVSNDNVKEIYAALTSSTKLNKQTKKIIEELQPMIPK